MRRLIYLISILAVSALAWGCTPASTATPSVAPGTSVPPSATATPPTRSTSAPTPPTATIPAPTPTATELVQLLPLDTPRFVLPPGPYVAPASIEIVSDEPGAELRYTTDGSAPSIDNGLVYEGPIALEGTAVVRAVAVREGNLDSDVVEAEYLVYGRIVEQNEPLVLSGDDALEIVDTYFVLRNDIHLSGNAKLVLKDTYVKHEKAYTFQYSMQVFDTARVVVEDSIVANQCTGSLNWNFFDQSSMSALNVKHADCNTWQLFTNDAAADITNWTGLGATFCDRAVGTIARSDDMEIELCFPEGSVVDEALPLEIKSFSFPNENDQGIGFTVNITDSTLDGWGIGLPPRADITIRDAPGVTTSIVIGYPWENETVVLEDLVSKHYADQTWEVLDSRLRFLNVTTYGWEPNAFGGNTIVIRNSDYAASGNNSADARYEIENSRVGSVATAERVQMVLRNSTITGDVVARDNSHITLIDCVVGVPGDEDNGNVVAIGNATVTMINTTVHGTQSTEDDGRILEEDGVE